MKKLLVLISVIILNSCAKDPEGIPNPSDAPPISSVPASFQQKVIVENFTSTSCGDCPKADLILDSLILAHPGRVFGASFHINDIMSDTTLNNSSGDNYYDSTFNSSGVYPSGMVNRIMSSSADLSPANWISNVQAALGRAPACGVAIEANEIVGSILKLKIHVGFNQSLAGDYRIHAYIVENVVQSNDSIYDQMNNFSINGTTPDTTSSLYALDDTIHLYKHNHIIRKVISSGGYNGAVIPPYLMVKGSEYVINSDVDITGINQGNSVVVVFVDKYATTPFGHWIENVQSVPIGSTKDWN